MNIQRKHIQQAVDARIITPEQAAQLSALWQNELQHKAGFTFNHVLYYLGGLLAIGAMSLFMTLGFEQFGGLFVTCVSLIYMGIVFALTEFFKKKQLSIPAGICAALIIVLVPLAVFGIQDTLGYWEAGYHYRDYHRWVDWRWLTMELATLAAAIALFKRYRYAFMVMPVAFTLWYLSMDITDWLIERRQDGNYTYYEMKSWVSIAFGIIMLWIAGKIDFRQPAFKQDYAFWLYLFGTLTFWGGLSSLNSDNELGKFIYCCINVAMVLCGAVVQRRVFTVFGALGVMFYLGHLANGLFRDSWLFPPALSVIGLGIVGLGVWWQKHETQIRAKLLQMLPEKWSNILAQKY